MSGLIPAPGRIVIGSIGATRVGSDADEEIEADEFDLEWGLVRAGGWKYWTVSLCRSERTEIEEGDVAIFPWPLELSSQEQGDGVWDHRSIVVPGEDPGDAWY